MPNVSLSSAGVSAAIPLDYIGAKGTSFSVTASTSDSVNYVVQGSLDAPQLVTTPSWFDISSATTSSAVGGVFAGLLAGIRPQIERDKRDGDSRSAAECRRLTNVAQGVAP